MTLSRWPDRRRARRAAAMLGIVAVLAAGCGSEVAGVAARGGSAASATPPSLPEGSGSTTGEAPPTTASGTASPTGTPATTSLPTTSSRPAPTTAATTPPTTTPRTTTPPTTTPRSTPRATPDPTSSRPATGAVVTATLGDSGAIEIGAPSAKIVMDVYEEPLCPPCATFSARYGADIAAAALSGKVKVRFRIANFLDRQSHSGSYSTRAIAALLTVLAYDRNPRTVLAVQDAIFDDRNQPVEGADSDLTDAQLASLAQRHGAGAESAAAIRKGLVRKSATATARLTAAEMTRQRITGVPWVQVGGRTVDLDDPQWLTKALTG